MCRVSRLVWVGFGKTRAHREEEVEQSRRHIIGRSSAEPCQVFHIHTNGMLQSVLWAGVGCVSRPARVLMDMAPTINMAIPINHILMSEAKMLATLYCL